MASHQEHSKTFNEVSKRMMIEEVANAVVSLNLGDKHNHVCLPFRMIAAQDGTPVPGSVRDHADCRNVSPAVYRRYDRSCQGNAPAKTVCHAHASWLFRH